MDFDAFNGDADGICALHQLRLALPREAVLVTGVKRDIALLDRIDASAGDRVVALDISLKSNLDPLLALLERGARVQWFDHHEAGPVPAHAGLEPHIDLSPDTCTSLIVDGYLGGRCRPWAIVGAFGDNLSARAAAMARELGVADEAAARLRELGTYLNYNAYGETLDDLHVDPHELYRRVHEFADPSGFIAESPIFSVLAQGYADDMARTRGLSPAEVRPGGAVFLLPDADWARRVTGVFANQLAREQPERAHAILTLSRHGHYVASVRAPLSRKTGAVEVCRRFPTGGGRAAAAGVNALPPECLPQFVEAFFEVYSA